VPLPVAALRLAIVQESGQSSLATDT